MAQVLTIASVISSALNALNSIMGGLFSSNDDGPDWQAIMAQKEAAFNQQIANSNAQHQEQMKMFRAREAAMEERESSYREQLATADARHQDNIRMMINSSKEERQRMEDGFQQERARVIAEIETERTRFKKTEEEFQREQARVMAEMEAERIRFEIRLDELAKSMQESEKRVADLAAELVKPIKNRQAKIDFVNGLNLTICQKETLLLVGPKGTGKSTFMWLLNRGEMPKQTYSDGTVEILQLQGYVDSIGLRGWTPEELLKLLVLMIYDGIPKDLIIFGNDRIDLPVTSLGLIGINNAMIVMMSGDFWKNYAPKAGGRKRINLVENINNGVRKVQPEADLDMVYNLEAYHDIKELGLGIPITHHDNIEALVEQRTKAGVLPFKFLLQMLKSQFTVKMENNNTIEMLFRFIYVYEKIYKKDKLNFMNHASLQEFSTLE